MLCNLIESEKKVFLSKYFPLTKNSIETANTSFFEFVSN